MMAGALALAVFMLAVALVAINAPSIIIAI
jgi:hypothetical protein